MKKIFLLYILAFIVSQQISQAQKKTGTLEKETPVAKIGNDLLSTDEFKTRYEFLPHPSMVHKNDDSLKTEFLASLLAERLWALEAKELHLDTLKLYQNMIKPVEKMLLRDALYKQEIDSKVKISDIDLVRGKARSNLTLKVLIISSTDSVESYEIYRQLKKGVSFDSLLRTRLDYSMQKEPVSIAFGKMDEEWMEDSLYRMKPKTFSKPMKNDKGWFIFKLVDKISGQADNSTGFASNVKNIIRVRRSRVIGTAFLEKLLSGIKVSFNPDVVIKLPDMALESFQKRKQINPADSANFHFTDFDVAYITSTFGEPMLSKPIAFFDSDSPTLNDFFYFLLVDDFVVKHLTKQNVSGMLQKKLNEYVQYELITREAYKRKLQNLPDVKKDIKMWQDNYLSQFIKKVFVDSSRVTDSDVYQYYVHETGKEKAGLKVNLIEIFTDNLDSVETILKKLKEGEAFTSLAEKYNQRKSTQAQHGAFGWQYTAQLGEIGKVAESMKEGEVYGPLKVEGGYSIFKLLEKKEAHDSVKESFESVKEKLKGELFSRRLYDNVNEGTAKLAQKFGVTIYDQAMKNLTVTEVNMFVYRYIGFGGRITGAPYTMPNFDWFDVWQKQKKLLP